MKLCPTCQRTHPNEIAFCPHDGTPLQANDTLPAGQVLDGRYEIKALLAETPGGQLYRAHDVRLDRHVALKIFRDELSREALRKQKALGQLRHPNVTKIYDLTNRYMVLEHIEGQTLDKVLRERGRFTPVEVAEALRPVADALNYALSLGITCEFLTLADITIQRAKNNPTHIILLPLIFNRRSTWSGASGASYALRLKKQNVAPYVAPELWHEDTSPEDNGENGRALVYSLGVIAYELLSGRKPDDASTPRDSRPEQAPQQPAPLTELAPDIPHIAARVVERALAREAKDRPATVREFVSEFQDALGMKKATIESFPMARGAMEVDEEKPVLRLPTDRATRSPAPEPKSHDDPAHPADATVADKPIYLDENVQFTVYQPETIAPARWYTLLAFAHLSKRRPDAPPGEPEPLAEVKRIAARVLEDQPSEYDTVKQNSLHAVPRAGEITFVPEAAGCEFNPPSQSFSWQKSVHKVEFELRASPTLDGQVMRGRLTVFLGSLILADVPLAIRVDARATVEARPVPAVVTPYRKIFPSYSHQDRAVVEEIEQHVHALGDTYLRDVTQLRAGQDWQRWMRDAIREADVFQLFWSHNSMRSFYVRQEWEYALSLGRQNFVRPTYWEQPLPESPAENLPPTELRQLHFQHLRASTISYHPAPAAAQHAPATPERQEHTATAVAAQPAVNDVLCHACGTRNSAAKAFCENCGTMLSAGAQPSVGAAATSATDAGNVLDVFWEKRERAAEHIGMTPYQQSLPLTAPKGRPLLLVGILMVLLFFIALAAGLYLLVSLL